MAALAVLGSACTLPTLEAERARPRGLPQTSFVYDANGTLITRLHAEQDRVLIAAGKIPRFMKDAVVAVEDQRFWTHRGVDLKAILRAASANVAEGDIVQGGSTITQQYVKNTIVGTERTVDRKLKEALLAYQLEQEMTKEEILAAYLNTVYFGQGAYGIQQAARTFFSRPAPRLNLPQAALLAGMIAGPGMYDPINQPEAAVHRRNHVLGRMQELGMIDADEYRWASTRKLQLDPAPERRRYPAAHFLEHVKQQILNNKRFGQTYTQRYNFLFAGGLRIYTTIDLEMQRAAEEAVHGTLSQPGDPAGALTAVDPRTGHIKAMVGGRDYFARPREDPNAKVNLATGGSTGRQAGSAFKPFALVAALEHGVSPSQLYRGGSSIALDDPVCRNSPTSAWVVQNYEGSASPTMTLEEATARSTNVVYAQVIRDLGPDRVNAIARRMGIRSKLKDFCSSVLGANEVNTLEMSSAYGTLANGGVHVAPVAIERITDVRGRVLWEPRPREEQAVTPPVAYVATRILQGVIEHGTGLAAQIGRPAAGKTGTAQQWRDAWFAGYIPQLSAAVWVGFPDGQVSMVPPTTRLRVTGGSFPAQIWAAFMAAVTEGMPVRDFAEPDDQYVLVAIDTTRGCVATELTPPDQVRELEFVIGTQPTVPCEDEEVVGRVAGEVPSVIGMSVEIAAELLRQAGFSMRQTIEYNPHHVPGTVIRQTPPAGSIGAPGSAVTLVVSTNDPPVVVVPDVVGMRESRARAVLDAAGLAVQVIEASKHDASLEAGRVLAQTPAGGTDRPRGSAVTITVNPAAASASPKPSPSP
jgi:penicillin-binding protein 1A